ncbi:hypothetical protein [Streptomyces sp. S07_1.15]|nr:hypothetical protein [Streptomyces sp. S07_1.15]
MTREEDEVGAAVRRSGTGTACREVIAVLRVARRVSCDRWSPSGP